MLITSIFFPFQFGIKMYCLLKRLLQSQIFPIQFCFTALNLEHQKNVTTSLEMFIAYYESQTCSQWFGDELIHPFTPPCHEIHSKVSFDSVSKPESQHEVAWSTTKLKSLAHQDDDLLTRWKQIDIICCLRSGKESYRSKISFRWQYVILYCYV